MRTKDMRPWWWWLNPWLYIKRRDIAYDTALDIISEQGKSIGRLMGVIAEAKSHLVPKIVPAPPPFPIVED